MVHWCARCQDRTVLYAQVLCEWCETHGPFFGVPLTKSKG